MNNSNQNNHNKSNSNIRANYYHNSENQYLDPNSKNYQQHQSPFQPQKPIIQQNQQSQQKYDHRPILQETSANQKPKIAANFADSVKDPFQQNQEQLQQQQQLHYQQNERVNTGGMSQIYQQGNRYNISPDKFIKKMDKDHSDLLNSNMEDINRQLDENMNDLVKLMNRRKALISHKKKLMKSNFESQAESLRLQSPQELFNSLSKENIQDQLLQEMIVNSAKQSQISSNLCRDLLSANQTGQSHDLGNSQQFWNQNKQFESEVDTLLKKLKYYDQELENSNSEVQNICSKLDYVDDNIKDLLLQKSEENLQQAEPFFAQKQSLHDSLKGFVGARNKLKDEKINLIYQIIQSLESLKNLRESRLKNLMNVFGLDTLEENEGAESKISQYIEFVDQLENFAKLKEKIVLLEQDESPINQEIDKISYENEQILAEMVRKQSQEAKIYAEYQDYLNNRLNTQKVIELFMMSSKLSQFMNMEVRDILKKFKDNIVYLKPLVEEDQAIRQGLNKTQETISTFSSILSASQNEKERTKELIGLLEECHKHKDMEEQKIEDMRNQDIDVTKKQKQKLNLEEDLETLLTDADLESYKKLGNQIKKYDYDIQQLQRQKQRTQEEISQIQQEVLKKMNLIKNEYDDVIREFIPNNLMNTYDFQRAGDIKNVKNQLKKAFKRLLGDHFQGSSQVDSYM